MWTCIKSMQPNSALFINSYRKTFGKVTCSFQGFPRPRGLSVMELWTRKVILWNALLWALEHRSTETLICSTNDARELRGLIPV